MRFGRSKRSREESQAVSGLTLLYPDDDVQKLVHMLQAPRPSANYGLPVDIIAIHGLNGHAKKTWTHTSANGKLEEQTFWLQDLLYESLADTGRVRVWTYGYDASVLDNSCSSSIRNIAEGLIAALETREDRLRLNRELKFEKIQPRIIFVAHSMGGLVVKKALLTLKNIKAPGYDVLFKSVHGVVFLGTPHQGSVMADYARFILRAIKPLVKSNKAFLDALKTGSEELRNLTKEFCGLSTEHIYALTIVEKRKTRDFAIVVTEESARMGWDPMKEEVTPFNQRDHEELARYRPSEQDYITLSGKIKRMVESAGKGIALNSAEKERLMAKLNYNYFARRNNVSGDFRCEGTCEWLRKEPKFLEWHNARDSRNIWLSGDVGSGKSTLSAYFLDSLPDEMRERSFYYFVDAKPQSRVVTTALRSLLYQVLEWEERGGQLALGVLGEGPGIEDLERLGKAFTDVLRHLCVPMVILVIDGVDEYHQTGAVSSENESKNELRNFLKIIVGISAKLAPECYIKCFFTSRPHIIDTVKDLWPEIAKEIHFTFEIPRQKTQEDVHMFVDKTYKALVEKHRGIFEGAEERRKVLLGSIPSRVKEKAGSSFLIARLSMDMCEDPINLRTGYKLKRLIDTIGAATGKLKETYEGVLNAIPKDFKQEAERLFKWLSVVKSKRGFTLEEAHAILVFREEVRRIADFDVYNDKDVEKTIKRVGASLIRVSGTETEKSIGWFHISAQEFLCQDEPDPETVIDGWTFTKSEARLEIALKCLKYLSFPDSFVDRGPLGLRYHVGAIGSSQLSDGPSSTHASAIKSESNSSEDAEFLEFGKEYPLITYIAHHWAHHVLDCEEIIRTQHWHEIERLVENPVGLVTAARFCWYEKSRKYRAAFPEKPSWLHLFAYFGLTSFTRKIMHNVDPRTYAGFEAGFTPLQLAAMNGHTDLVRYFLHEHEDMFSLRQERSPSSVELSLEFGHHDTVKVFVNEFKVSVDLPKALELVVTQGFRDLVECLLEMGADIDCKLPEYGSVMEAAAAFGDENFILFLMRMKTPAPVEGTHPGRFGHPLAAAAFKGHNGAIRVLKTVGQANVNLKRGVYSTALQAAAAGKQEETVRILLDFGALKELVEDEECRKFIDNTEKKMLQSSRPVEDTTDESIAHRVSLPSWMRTRSAASNAGSHKTNSTAHSVRRARNQFIGTMRKIQIAILTESEFGYEYLFPIPLAALEVAVRMESKPLLFHFADVGMDILYTALANNKLAAFEVLTKDLWMKALRIPLSYNKPDIVEDMLKRCLSKFIKLINSDSAKALILVDCGIEMFLAIAEDGNPTLLDIMASLWVDVFEEIWHDKNGWYVFREKVVTHIHKFANRFLDYFEKKQYLETAVMARTGLAGLLHALERRRYRAVTKLMAIYLPMLEKLLQPNRDTKKYEIRWIAELKPDQAHAALKDETAHEIIKSILHIGTRLYYAAFLDQKAPPELTVEINTYRYYISAVLINALAQSVRVSSECLEMVQKKILEVFREDTIEKTSGYVASDSLKEAYSGILKMGQQEIERRYKGHLQEEEKAVFETVESAIVALLEEM